MVTLSDFKKLALKLEGTEEVPHFEKSSFRVKKRIFATLDEISHRACLKLSETDQSTFCCFDKTIIFPVPNKWGKQGWTYVELSQVKKEMLKDALQTAYNQIAAKKNKQ